MLSVPFQLLQSVVVRGSEPVSFQKAPAEKVQAPLAVSTRGASRDPAAGPALGKVVLQKDQHNPEGAAVLRL